MNKNVKGIIAVVAVAGLVFGVWMLTTKGKKNLARYIVKKGGSQNLAGLMTFDEGYLKEWAKSLRAGRKTFTYNGKDYNTEGGKALPV